MFELAHINNLSLYIILILDFLIPNQGNYRINEVVYNYGAYLEIIIG